MFVGGVIQNKIEDDTKISLVRFAEKIFEVIERAVFGRDIAIIADVITAIPVGGGEVRRKPERVHAEIFQILKFLDHAFEVADAIAVSVSERAWIDLIKDCGLPPFKFGHMKLLNAKSFDFVEIFYS